MKPPKLGNQNRASPNAATPQGRPPADRPGWSRVLGFGEDPLLWSFPVGRVLGAQFRVHALVPVWVLAEAINAGRTDRNSLIHVLPAIALVFCLALGKELARVAAARRCGHPIGSIVLWPLGALAVESRGPLTDRRAHGAGAGILMLACLCMASLFVLADGAAAALVFNPLAPQPQIAALATPAQAFAWWGFYAAVVLLLANLLPILPLDAGRALEARLLGSPRAPRVLQLQVLGACSAFLAAVFADQPRIIIAAAVACVACWVALRRLAFVPAPAPPAAPVPGATGPRAALTLDEILAKVSVQGVAGLTDEERAELERASARLRGRE